MKDRSQRRLPLLAACVLFAVGCAPLNYDLSSVPLPISAKPVDESSADVTPFRIESSNTLYIHGLAGHHVPDVAALVTETSAGYDRIAGFRVKQTAGVSHWLLTHLSLTMIRMKKVVIEGQLIRD